MESKSKLKWIGGRFGRQGSSCCCHCVTTTVVPLTKLFHHNKIMSIRDWQFWGWYSYPNCFMLICLHDENPCTEDSCITLILGLWEIAKTWISGDHVSEFCVTGGPMYLEYSWTHSKCDFIKGFDPILGNQDSCLGAGLMVHDAPLNGPFAARSFPLVIRFVPLHG